MAHETLSVVRPRWLGIARTAWVVFAAAALIVFVASVRAYWLQLNTICADPSRKACNFTQVTPVMHEVLQRLGISIGAYAAYTLAIHVAASLALLTVGALVFWRRSDGWYGLFVSLLLITFGTFGPSAVLSDAFGWAYPGLGSTILAASDALSWLVFPALGLFLVTFPDGRFVPRWSFIVVLLWTLQAVFWETIDALPPPLFAAELLLVWGSTLAVQVYRYLRVSDVAQRQQTKWVLYGFALGVSTIVVAGLLGVAFPSFGERGSAYHLLEGTWVALLFTPIPLSIGIAVLKYRLWEIDPIINRTLVYGTLTVAVVGMYVLVVGYLGALFRTGGNLAISLVATGLVAMLFQPLRDRLQRGVNRLMYGDRDEPYAVLSRLGQRLESTLAPKAVLPAIVETVAGALKSPHAEVLLLHDGAFETSASRGVPTGEPLVLPLVYGNETIGKLAVSPRAEGEPFTLADQRLLEDLARQAGVAAHAVRLTSDLQRSRERLVTAREEERRRLRRNLHDGVGPQLAALTLEIETARNRLSHNPATRDLLSELAERVRTAVVDVRGAVHELRPPALDELGLVDSLRETAAQYSQNGLQVTVRSREYPLLPAAVEVAAYRIVQEALTNVVRHSGARVCTVRLDLDKEAGLLRLEIEDDGRGVGVDRGLGVGLSSMRERAEELGGTCTIGPGEAYGTRVLAELPCSREPDA